MELCSADAADAALSLAPRSVKALAERKSVDAVDHDQTPMRSQRRRFDQLQGWRLRLINRLIKGAVRPLRVNK